MFKCIYGETANDMWIQAYNAVINSDSVGSRNGTTREILHAALSINDPVQKWVSCRTPPISIGYALADLIWILAGSDDAQVINYWNTALPNYAGEYRYYPGAYGNRIFYKHGINQLEKVYETLKNNPESRQAVIIIWDPKIDLPYCDGFSNNKDIPCNICSLIKVRNGKLEWTQIMRSNDLVLGLPYNIVQFTSIQEILASWLNVEVGTYNHISDSLHIYEEKLTSSGMNDLTVINGDSLGISKYDFPNVINILYKNMQIISQDTKLTTSQLVDISNQETGYEAYNNILRILCAYAANKRQDYEAREIIINLCTNQAYITMWNNWLPQYLGGKKHVKND